MAAWLAILALSTFQEEESDALLRTRVALEYYALWNGGFPEKLDDLVTPPQGAPFRPPEGFLPEKPDVPYVTGRLGERDLVRRTENSSGFDPKQLLTRYRLAQLRAAAAAFLARRKHFPLHLSDLNLPFTDGWGNEFRIIAEGPAIRISSPGRPLPHVGAEIAPETRDRVAELVRGLSSPDEPGRQKAFQELDKMGLDILPLLESHLKALDDLEVKTRLGTLFQSRWMRLLEFHQTGLEVSAFLYANGKKFGDGEAGVPARLLGLRAAEDEFRKNDPDANRRVDFWVGDLTGLHRLRTKEGNPLALIDAALARSDARPLPRADAYAAVPDWPVFPQPLDGYLFRAVPYYRDGSEIRPYPSTDPELPDRNLGRFAFCAFPAEYGTAGRMTFLIREDGKVLKKDTGGEPVWVAPSLDAEKEDWR